MYSRRLRPILLLGTSGENDADWLLDALENARCYIRLMAFGRAVDHPNVRAIAAEVVAHLLKTGATEIGRRGDEADDTGAFGFRLPPVVSTCPDPKTFHVAHRQKYT